MIKEYNTKSLAIGIPGLLLQSIGVIALGPVVTTAGTILLLVGLAYYAKAKGRRPAWCLMAFLSIMGLIVLYYLKDKAVEQKSEDK